jgi:hypothetical protein
LNRRLIVLLAFIVLATTPVPTTAQDRPLVFEFATDAGMTASSFNVIEGQTIRIRVYLRERDAQGTLLGGDGGLATSAVRVTYGAGSAATVANPTDIAPAVPPWADGNTIGTDAGGGVVNVNSPFTQGVAPTDGRVFLGTFTFTGHRGGSVALGAVDRNLSSDFDTTTFTNANALDPLIDPGAATLTVIPVSEPAAVLAAAVAGLAALGGIRRAGRQRATPAGAP